MKKKNYQSIIYIFCNECIKNLKGTYLQYLYDSNNQKYVSNELKLTLKHKSQG